MDSKKLLPDSFNPADVAPLPSAPPPSYDDAMGTSSAYGGVGIQQSTPAMAGNSTYPPQQPVPYPVQSNQPQPYPVQSNQPQSYPVQTNQPQPYPVQPTPAYPVQQVQIANPGVALPNRYLPVGRHPLKTTCTGCNANISTRITSRNNCHPTFWCIVLFMTGESADEKLTSLFGEGSLIQDREDVLACFGEAMLLLENENQ